MSGRPAPGRGAGTKARGAAADAAFQEGPGADRPLDVLGYLAGLWRWIPLGLLVAGLVFAGVWQASSASAVATPATGDAVIAVHVPQPTQLTGELVATYAALGARDPLIAAAGEQVGLDLTAARPKVQVSQYAQSLLIVVAVKGQSVQEAEDLTKAMREVVIAEVPQTLPAGAELPTPTLTAVGDVRVISESAAASGSGRASVKANAIRLVLSLGLGLAAMVAGQWLWGWQRSRRTARR